MLILGGSDVIRCKMFVGTLTGTTLKWFSKLPLTWARHGKLFPFNMEIG